MPTTLPARRARRRPPTFFLVWVVALLFACIAIELVDPAPMDLAAAFVAAP